MVVVLMPVSIGRNDAITLLCDADLASLTPDERLEEIEGLIYDREQGRWEQDPQWTTIPADVRAEIETHSEIHDAADSRYNPAIALSLRDRYVRACNEFLINQLYSIGREYHRIIGFPPPLSACPCCGAYSLEERGDWEICTVCWWEDDGSDNFDAMVESSPNHLSLIRARINYLTHGIFDPSRHDLRDEQEPLEKYERGRTFVLSDDGRSFSEPSVGWLGSLDDCR